jgi:hypothetical protein
MALRQRQLSPDQYEIVDVRTSRGVLRPALLIPKAVLKATDRMSAHLPSFTCFSSIAYAHA